MSYNTFLKIAEYYKVFSWASKSDQVYISTTTGNMYYSSKSNTFYDYKQYDMVSRMPRRIEIPLKEVIKKFKRNKHEKKYI